MAEIKIEKKKPVWPWILLVIILLAAIAYFIYANSEEDDDYPDDMDTEEIDDVNDNTLDDSTTYEDAVNYSDTTNVLMQYSESIKDSTRIGTDSTYTKSALSNLVKVVIAKAEEYNVQSSKALEDLKSYTSQMDGMTNSSMSNTTDINKNLKTVSTNIVSVLEAIQTKQFPALQKEVADLKQTAAKMTTTSLENQQATLQTFFRKANDVLNNMNS